MHYSICLVFFLQTAIDATQILQGPQNANVLVNQPASFNCTLTMDWTVLIWNINQYSVLTITKQYGPIVNSNRYMAHNYTTTTSFISELTILQTERSDSGTVTCILQNGGQMNASLSVQVNGTLQIANQGLSVLQNTQTSILCQANGWLPKPTITWMVNGSAVDSGKYSTRSTLTSSGLYDMTSTLAINATQNVSVACLASIPTLSQPLQANAFLTVTKTAPVTNFPTVLVAVVCSVCGALLLLFLILLILLCCKRRKRTRPNYQEEMRKAAQVRAQNRANAKPLPAQGEVNRGFSTDNTAGEDHAYAGITLNDYGNYKNNTKIPNVVQASNSPSELPRRTQYPAGTRKVRHLTAV
ncbi:immunoglobulin superfamily member 5 isoform X2 [Amia ocellicauda]|uniref:immunoglobulin superfamily member 5 isoform X2 n=1 Tax=Amia ocellicauda TaxID=2972642 RepID=UPI0034648D3C